jgi:hypothetical protein
MADIERQAPTVALAEHLGGFAAAEGTFTRAVTHVRADGWPRLSVTFAVALGASDGCSAELLRAFLGVGRVRTYPRRRPHYDDEVVFAVRAFRDLVDVVVPFMDEHLPPSHKRTQYETWRRDLLAYDAARSTRPAWSRTRRPAADPSR